MITQAITILWWSSSQSTLKNEQRSLSHLRIDVFGEIQHLVMGVGWCKVSCLAHVINLATQALIKGHSNAKYYNPATPDEHIPDVDAYLRDEVGLIRAIAVKVILFWSQRHTCVWHGLRNDLLRNGRNYFEQYSQKGSRRKRSLMVKLSLNM